MLVNERNEIGKLKPYGYTCIIIHAAYNALSGQPLPRNSMLDLALTIVIFCKLSSQRAMVCIFAKLNLHKTSSRRTHVF